MVLYTPTTRTGLAIATAFPLASHVTSGDDEDVFQIGDCRISCRYWTRGGDFVSKQILGCHNAVRTGRLRCASKDAVERQVCETKSVIGIVGPDDAIRSLALALAERYSGVLVDGENADLAEQTAAADGGS
jgi:hypothetical protein